MHSLVLSDCRKLNQRKILESLSKHYTISNRFHHPQVIYLNESNRENSKLFPIKVCTERTEHLLVWLVTDSMPYLRSVLRNKFSVALKSHTSSKYN